MIGQVSPANVDLTASFRSHENYLCAFGTLAGFPYWPGKGHEVLEQVANDVIAAFPKASGPRQFSVDELSACLNPAWETELLLAGRACL
jgi:hypothetical protein